MKSQTLQFDKKLILVHGKGGVGKTAISQAISHFLSQKGKKTLWVTIEDPTHPTGDTSKVGPSLWHLNIGFIPAFEEYIAMKIAAPALAHIFLKNKIIQQLSKVAPGVPELVVLGKLWHERIHYDHVVVDLPSTGYGLAMFHSTRNFIRLFQGGPLHRDALAMEKTFENPIESHHTIVAIPEETPLRESIDLKDELHLLFPKNPPSFLVNRVFPKVDLSFLRGSSDPKEWPSPYATSYQEYSAKRYCLENQNLKIWDQAHIQYQKLEYFPPQPSSKALIENLVQGLASINQPSDRQSNAD